MEPPVGALAVVLHIDGPQVWVKYGSGNFGFLAEQDGPTVSEGTVILVSLEDSSFITAPQEVFPNEPTIGSLATVLHRTPEGVLWFRLANGAVGWVEAEPDMPVDKGSVIFVAGGKCQTVPDELTEKSTDIGVILRLSSDRALVETGRSIIWIDIEQGAPWRQWSTIEFDESGIVGEIDSKPIRYGDEPPRSIEAKSRFLVDPESITERLGDLSGLDQQVSELREILDLWRDSESLKRHGVIPIRGLLFAGASGTGKTMMARALAKERGAAYFQVRGPEIASKWVNESEELLRELMDQADRMDRAIVFFDEIDSLGLSRSLATNEMSNKLVTQFLTLLDGFNTSRRGALIIGATNRPEALDPTLLRSGRFDRVIEFRLPSAAERVAIFESTVPSELTKNVDTIRLSELSSGFSGADIRSLWAEAIQFARSEYRKYILQTDCEIAIERIRRRQQKSQPRNGSSQ